MNYNNDYCEVERTDSAAKEYPVIRNLDGCYFRVERGVILSGMGVPWLISLVDCLADALRAIGDAFDIKSRDE